MDIRLLNKDNSNLLKQLHYIGEYIFALDDIKTIPLVDEKFKTLLTWVKSWNCKFYVYVNPDMPLGDTITRIEYLKSIKALPYVMRDLSCWNSKYNEFYIDLAAYCNQPNMFKTKNFYEFLKIRYKNQDRIDRSAELYYGGV